jgi:hypothetical protein
MRPAAPRDLYETCASPVRTRWRIRLRAPLRAAFLAGALIALFGDAGTAQAPASSAPQAPPAKAGPRQLPKVQARRATGPIVIDGKLNEPDWQDAEPIFLTQQSPHPGQSTPYTTEVRVLISGDALVFGFKCRDPKPSEIRVHTLTQDGDQSGDDTVSIVLDSFGDKRTGYYFQINADGGRVDGLVSGPLSFSLDWDGIWNARTARTADGWSAEIWIPAQTLTFVGGNNHWGLELDRSIERDLTEMRWASPSLDASLFDMRRAGELEIMSPLKQGHGLEFAPYVRGTMLRDFIGQGNLSAPPDPSVPSDPSNPTRNWLAAGGGEITWRITPQMAAILSVNTDFAETEVDARQINVTPFPLYFPEKRAFFLEGANQYTFGVGLDTTFLPFYSRNVGLLDGYDIPLNGGVKLNGHIGPWSLAFLDVQTRKTYVPNTVVDYLGLPSAKVEGTNLLATRVAYDVDKHLRVGAIATHGDPEALLSNFMAGADAVWSTSTFLHKRNLVLGGWGATTQGDVPVGDRQAWGIRMDYPNDLWYCTAGTERFGSGFDPLLGFLPRPATHQEDGGCSYRPRPSPAGHFRAIRQDETTVAFSRITDTSGNLQSQALRITPLSLQMNSGDIISVHAYIRHETLTTPFSIVPTVTYPVGSFDFQRYNVSLDTSPQRQVTFSNSTSFGGYYNGHLLHQTNSLNWTPLHGKVEAGATVSDYFGHTPQGNFVERLYQFKGALSWSPDLSLSTFVQYDNVSYDLSSNTRLRWTFKPGDDFYVVWDRTWVRNVVRPGLNLDPDAESLIAKIRWTFRP